LVYISFKLALAFSVQFVLSCESIIKPTMSALFNDQSFSSTDCYHDYGTRYGGGEYPNLPSASTKL